MNCTACSSANPDNARFCLHCGATLDGRAALTADPQRAMLERALGVQYELGSLLGRGGMGAVYYARERALERPVAIKVLPPDLASDTDSRERFRREARTAARLTHPNIVPLHTFGETEGMLFFVMGYVRGESLGQRLRRETRLPAEEVRRIVGELADALDYAHRQGVIHRDIKPDNVLLDHESGRPLLTDFGVARARATGATLTEVGTVVGTPHYMSPEQASGARDLDGRSDLYSLGVMAYAMLAGRLPFEGESFRDVIVQHMTRAPVPLASVAPNAPTELVDAISRCLEKEPTARWADGRSLRAAIDLLEGDDVDFDSPLASVQAAVPKVAIMLAADACFAGASYLIPALHAGRSPWFALPIVIAGVFVGGYAIAALLARQGGISWASIRRAALEPPRLWGGWYPERWRAHSDVWARLPMPLKRARIAGTVANTLLWGSFPVAGYGLLRIFTDVTDTIATRYVNGSLVPIVAAVATLIWSGIVTNKWGKTRSLLRAETIKAMSVPTSRRDFWRRPKFAALLLPPSGTLPVMAAPEPGAPAEYLAAILRAASECDGPLRLVVDDAAVGARRVLDALARLDAELATLARDASPDEIAAVDKRLAALGRADDDSESRAELRKMLEGQRELLGRLAGQLANATARRERLVHLLRTLWLQVATLRADAARDALAESEVSGLIRAAIDEIGAHVEAAATLRVTTGA